MQNYVFMLDTNKQPQAPWCKQLYQQGNKQESTPVAWPYAPQEISASARQTASPIGAVA